MLWSIWYHISSAGRLKSIWDKWEGLWINLSTLIGSAVTLRLSQPWHHYNRIVCGDSFFASVQTAEVLMQLRLHFVGVVKTATRMFQMHFLSHQELSRRGYLVAMQSVTDIFHVPNNLLVVMWMERERQYFISTTSSTFLAPSIHVEIWCTQNVDTTKEELTMSISQLYHLYYSACVQIIMMDAVKMISKLSGSLKSSNGPQEWTYLLWQFLLLTLGNFTLDVVDVDYIWVLIHFRFNWQRASSTNIMTPLVYAGALVKGPENKKESLLFPVLVLSFILHFHRANGGRRQLYSKNAGYKGRCPIWKGNKKSKYICSEYPYKLHREVFLYHGETRRFFQQNFGESHPLSTN